MLRHLSAWAAIALLLVLPLQSAPAQSLDRPPATADTTRPTAPEAPPAADEPTAPAEDEAEQDGLFTEDVWDTGRAYAADHADDYVGAQPTDVPYRPSTVGASALAPIRYNRVDGLVLSLKRRGLTRQGNDRARLYGQVGYAFELKDIRFTAGGETRVFASESTDLVLGTRYRKETVTEDAWKASGLETSLAAGLAGDDFFDYYEAQGGSVYGRLGLPHSVTLRAGFRMEEHRSLQRRTTWALFGGGLPTNPLIDDGRLHSAVVSITGGSVDDFDGLPTGYAFRVEAELGDGLGGDFAFNRYLADGRLYLPMTNDTRFNLRLRGGYATTETPLQKRFTLGGVGSIRGFDQNTFGGTRMLLGNAEVLFGDVTVFDDILEDLFVAGFVDAGWTGGPGDRFAARDVLPSAGFGIGLDERSVRFDVAWPLRDVGSGLAPSFRLRLTPHF